AIELFRKKVPDGIITLISDLLRKDLQRRVKTTQEILKKLQSKYDVNKINTKEKSIAVLYFENMSPDKENDYFCAGITEDIIIDLSRISQLKVIPRSDILSFRNREANSRKIGEILGVNYILEGSVRKAGKQIRVTTQLINVQTGYQMWGERYDRLLEDIFDVQTELSQKIAEALKGSLTDSEKKLLARKPTDDLRAHDFYMRGRDFLMTGGKTNNESAIKMFEHALSIDPDYSLAYVALSEAYSFQYTFYDGDQKWLGMIISASEKARELNPDLLETEITKGIVFYHQKRFSEAKQIFEKFIARRNNYYPAYYWLGVIAQIQKDYDEALTYFIQAADLKPYSEEPWIHIAMIYHRKNKIQDENSSHQKAIDLIRKKMEVNPDDVIALSRAAVSHAILGNTEEALNLLNKVMEIAPNDGLALYNCACTYAQLDKKEEAFALLQKAIGKGYNNIIEWVENDPDFEKYRDDPHFKSILSKAAE
ncbi:MAG: TPR end-of-group domain-containing protein, partial [Anaerolineales bacterium]